MKNSTSRREFIKTGAKAGIAVPLLLTGLSSCISGNEEKKEKSLPATKKKGLRILILGGTSFLGPHQIAYSIERGHSISTFTRGKTEPTVHKDLFKNVEQLIGDREDNLTALQNRKWDAVIDNSGRNAEWTKRSAELLKENCDLYLYTSSTGVYYPYLKSNYKETDQVLLKEPEAVAEEEKLEYWYGVMKANSELEAINQFGKDRTIVVRPTYMIGPADKSNRFIHWPIRLSKGGEVLVPGKADDMVQYMDVRDVAEWMIRLIENKNTGTFNAVGPKEQQNMYSFVEEAKKAFSTDNSLVKIDDYDFLKEKNIYHIVPWIMPTEKNKGSAKVNNEKAIVNGLSFTPLAKTVKDTYDWWTSDAVSEEQREKVESDPKSVLAREEPILEEWKAR
ncbi:NAD-dependent epimerase/dehydratase family protein [Winogradskyella sp. A3E31]|uniref:NAD-dependent epimerase/dehydratase family protein n=1 Tax=Winogradskyella sp. A3E31 TaxID=3349637 RepID=UPI00398B3BA1